MRKSLEGLHELTGREVVVRIDRTPMDEHEIDGFVVGVGTRLLLLHEVEGDTLLPNGYETVRLRDVRSWREDGTFVGRALRLLGRHPVTPEGMGADAAALADWGALLAWARERYPLVMVETEKKEPGVGFIGRVAGLTARHVDLEKVDSFGRWDETERFALSDVTRVGFGDGYVEALALLVAHEGGLQEGDG